MTTRIPSDQPNLETIPLIPPTSGQRLNNWTIHQPLNLLSNFAFATSFYSSIRTINTSSKLNSTPSITYLLPAILSMHHFCMQRLGPKVSAPAGNRARPLMAMRRVRAVIRNQNHLYWLLPIVYGRWKTRGSGKGPDIIRLPVCDDRRRLGRYGWAGACGDDALPFCLPSSQSTISSSFQPGVKAAPLSTRSLGGRDHSVRLSLQRAKTSILSLN